MNFSRALTTLRSVSSKQRLLHAPVTAVHSHLFSTKASQNKRSVQKKVKPLPEQDDLRADPIMNLKRPIEIPFHPRIANTVQLIGTVGVPVQKETLSDGRVTAVSVLIQEYPDLPKLWIPIIFQGELAEVAGAYLKENEKVFITGQLNGDTEPVKVNKNQANVQVLAHTLQYVVDSGPDSFKDAIDAGAELVAPMIKEKEGSVSYTEAVIADDLSSLQLWSDLLNNPNDWYDNRAKKIGKAPDFRHKRTKQGLWISKSTPSWVILKLEEPPSSWKNPISSPKQGERRKPNSLYLKLWDDVVANTQNWVDNRMDKQNGLVKVNFPDFKNMVTKDALWINTAPELILEQMDQLKFGSYSVSRGKPFSSNGAQSFSKSSSSNRSQTYFKKNGESGATSKDALWKSLVDDPKKWWDNRSKKLKPNQPDFRHKETGEALWIGKTTPQWVLANLPSENAEGKKSGTCGDDYDVPTKSFKTTLLS